MVTVGDHILLDLLFAITGLALLFLMLLIFFRFYNTLREKHIQRITKVFNKYLVSYLLDDPASLDKSIQRIKKFSKRKTHKNILINQLLLLNHNFSGVTAQRVSNLYVDLDLYKASYHKLKSWKWHQKVRGMYELSTLEYEPAFEDIAQLIYHSKGEVRRNARVSLVKIRKKEALMTLKDINGSVSTWTFINILSILKRNPVKLTDEELTLLKSAKNEYIRSLTTKLEQTVYVQ